MKHIVYGIGGFDPNKPNNNVIEEIDVPDPPAPETCTPATIRIALRRLYNISNSQLEQSVQFVISNITNEDDRADANDLWNYASTINRNHPLVISVGSHLGLTSEQIDRAFRYANRI